MIEEKKLKKTKKRYDDVNQGVIDWAEKIAEYAQIKELNAEILNNLIERIEVHSRKEEDGKIVQTIEIFYRFGGYIAEIVFNATVLKHKHLEKISA